MRFEGPSPQFADLHGALWDTRGLDVRDWTDRLSFLELEALRYLNRPARVREWLAGRMLVKHLFLGRGASSTSKPPSTAWRIRRLRSHDLNQFPRQLSRLVEVQRGELAAARPQRVLFRGKRTPYSVSLTHRGQTVSACIDRSCGLGVDLEESIARRPPFYRFNYTPTERAWVESTARAGGLDRNWLFTLLWTLKEAWLKSGSSRLQSIWDLARLQVAPEGRWQPWSACRDSLGAVFSSFQATISEPDQRVSVQAAVTATSSRILSILTSHEKEVFP